MRLLSASETIPQVAQFSYPETGVSADLLKHAACGPPLRVYLALTHGQIGQDLTPEDLLNNRYFWFLRFAHSYHTAFGDDAGIDQQAFQILEQAECEVDWLIVEQLAADALLPY